MKYFSHSNQYVNTECQNCGRVLKIPHEKCVVAVGGLTVIPAVVCQCGTISNFIDDISSQYQKNANWTPKKNDHHMSELINLIGHFLPLNKWNFRLSAQYICHSNKWNSIESSQNYHGGGDPVIIYDSEKCRIQVYYSWSSREYERSINVSYGRLGIPDDARTLLRHTNQESYHLYWHSVYPPLYFLDGLSPQEAKNALHPRLVMEFEQSDLANGLMYEEKSLLLHATIWETYGERLFDIFDVHNKGLWEQYCKHSDWRPWLQPQ